MKERGLIFSGPMVQALLAGTKTMTRRPMKPSRSYMPPTSRFQVGDRIWVRETWCVDAKWDKYLPSELPLEARDTIRYKVDGVEKRERWRSPRFMPRWASRITREITAVRAEKVQGITDEEANPWCWVYKFEEVKDA